MEWVYVLTKATSSNIGWRGKVCMALGLKMHFVHSAINENMCGLLWPFVMGV